MRAIAVSEYGATPALTNLPRPEPGPGEILVRMVAAGLNPLDWKIADGMLKDSVDVPFPLILGRDGAGVVDEVGEGVTRLRHGEQVYGVFSHPERGLGSYAEYAIARDDMAGTMRLLGADETVDHSRGDLNGQVLAVHSEGIDAVLDMVSDATAAEHIAQLLRPGGTYISTVHSVNPDAMEARELRGVNYEGEPTAALLERLSDLIDAGALRVHLEREVPLAEAADALAANRAGGARGKTVIRI